MFSKLHCINVIYKNTTLASHEWFRRSAASGQPEFEALSGTFLVTFFGSPEKKG